MDRLTVAQRSRNMARVRSRNSAPELRVRSLLHRSGFRFRLHVRDLPGSPDIVLPRHRTVVFVHGCFWHRHAGCPYAYVPRSRTGFWQRKFADNVTRDARDAERLESMGWRVLVVWECDLRDERELASRLAARITGGSAAQ